MQYISKCALLNFLKEKRTKLKFLEAEVCEGLFSSQKCLTPLGEGVCNSENIQPNLPSERSLRSHVLFLVFSYVSLRSQPACGFFTSRYTL